MLEGYNKNAQGFPTEGEEYWTKKHSFDAKGLEAPSVSPEDMLAGGLMAAPKGIMMALGEVGTEVFMGLAQDAAQNDKYMRAAFLGERSLRNQGVNVAKDLVGQFSSVIDRFVRKEVPDFNMDQTFSEADIWTNNRLGDITSGGDELFAAHPQLKDNMVIPQDSVNSSFNPNSKNINIGVLSSPGYQQDSLRHEGGHVVQDADGLPKGASPEDNWNFLKWQMQDKAVYLDNEADDILDMLKNDVGENYKDHFLYDEYKAIKKESQRLKDTSSKIKEYTPDDADTQKLGKYIQQRNDLNDEVIELETEMWKDIEPGGQYEGEILDILDHPDYDELDLMLSGIDGYNSKINGISDKIRRKTTETSHKNYRNTVGEQESNAIINRADLSPEDRARINPISGFDPRIHDPAKTGKPFDDPSKDAIPLLQGDFYGSPTLQRD